MQKTWRSSLLIILALFLFPALLAVHTSGAQVSDTNSSGEEMIIIALGSNALSENRWKYTASKQDIVSEGSVDEFYARKAEKDKQLIPDEIPPGTTAFVFKGVNPGEIELVFTYVNPKKKNAKPENTATFKIKVYPDKTLAIVSSSENVY